MSDSDVVPVRRPRWGKWACLLLAASIMSGAAPPPAAAATVSLTTPTPPPGGYITFPELNFDASAGEANHLGVSFASDSGGGTYTFTDTGATITAGAGCSSVTSHQAACPMPSPIHTFTLHLGDMNDVVDVASTSRPMDLKLYGEDGADSLTIGAFGAEFPAIYGGAGNDYLEGGRSMNGEAGDDTLESTPGSQGLNGDAGNDTASYASRLAPVKVDLANGMPANGEPGENDILTNIENVTGGAGDDDLFGTAGANRLDGGPGDDLLDGALGPDTLVGGGGEDLADYSRRTAAVTADPDGQVGDDGEMTEGDAVGIDVEDVAGGAGSDVLSGNASANLLFGGAGNDSLSGREGDDTLDGGAGADVLAGGGGADSADYLDRTASVVVSLDGRSGDDGEEGEGDTVEADVENVLGGSGDDTLLGNASANELDGGVGNDRLDGQMGADRLLGGPDIDLADYSTRTAGVTVSLGGPAGSDGEAGEGDTVGSDVEAVWGGTGADVLRGSEADNLLFGGPGADLLSGGGGEDAADYSDRSSGVTVTLDGQSDDGNAEDGPAGARDNVAVDVEDVIGGHGVDTMTGSAADNVLEGGDGGDILTGGPGEDILFGDDGDDALISRDAFSDGVSCGLGTDTAEVDPSDEVLVDCEQVDRRLLQAATPPPPQPPVDRSAPVVTVRLAARQTMGSVLARGLRLRAGCSEACTLRLRLVLSAAAARALHLGSRRVGSARASLAQAGRVRIRVKLTHAARAALRHLRRVRLRLLGTGRDPAGNTASIKRTVALTRRKAVLASASRWRRVSVARAAARARAPGSR